MPPAQETTVSANGRGGTIGVVTTNIYARLGVSSRFSWAEGRRVATRDDIDLGENYFSVGLPCDLNSMDWGGRGRVHE